MQSFCFGMYRNLTLEDVLKLNPSYVYWCIWNIQQFYISDEALLEISKLFPNFIMSSEFMERNKQILEQDYYEDDDYIEEDYTDYDSDIPWGETPTYSRYNGTYAQDEMGYSDDEIDTIFDGEPDAYWNID